jgi:hypothetical protein
VPLDLRAILRQQGRKRPLTLRVQQTTQAQQRALYKLYLPVVHAWQDGAPRIVVEYARTLSQLTFDAPSDVAAEISATEEGAVRAVFDFRAFFTEWAQALNLWHVNRIGAQLTYATGLELTQFLGPVDLTVEDYLERNTALIRDISDQARGRIADIVFRGLSNRTPTRDVAKEINDAVGLGRKRALRVAIDQTVKLSAALDAQRGHELGFEGYEWQHSGKLHYRPDHKARDGKYFAFGSEIDLTDPPGYAPFCFPSDQPVAFHDDAVMLWRRPYSGELISLVTESGEIIRCTPNHPILTGSGWEAAQFINVGEKLIRSSECGVHAPNVDIHETQASIGDLFEAGKAVFGSVTINGVGSEFHGDAVPNEQIETVDSKRGLRDHFVSLHRKDHSQFLLEMTLSGTLAVCAPDLFTNGGSLSGPGAVGGLRTLESLLWAHLLPFEKPRLTVAADVHAALLHRFDDSWAGYADALRDGIGRLPALIGDDHLVNVELLGIVCGALDLAGRDDVTAAESLIPSEGQGSSVKQVIREDWAGHVYNLETKSGWYSAGTIAVKNCGCKRRLSMGPEE